MKQEGKQLRVMRTMPELNHWVGREDGIEWGPECSEVFEWMFKQVEILDWLMTYFMSKGVIRFDGTIRRWKGVEKGEAPDSVGEVDCVKVELDKVKSGRSSIVEMLYGKDYAPLLDAISKGRFSKRAAGRMARSWAGQMGIKVCDRTGVRFIEKLIGVGALGIGDGVVVKHSAQ